MRVVGPVSVGGEQHDGPGCGPDPSLLHALSLVQHINVRRLGLVESKKVKVSIFGYSYTVGRS